MKIKIEDYPTFNTDWDREEIAHKTKKNPERDRQAAT